MKRALIDIIKRTFIGEQKLHPLDGKLAKIWIKKRLVVVFPELRNDPKALEAAYHALSLEPRVGTEEDEKQTYFEMRLP